MIPSTPPRITRIPVESSMLFALGYDAEKQVLYAEFIQSGHIYAYEDVPQEVFDQLMGSKSKGSYFRALVIGCYGEYRVRRGQDMVW